MTTTLPTTTKNTTYRIFCTIAFLFFYLFGNAQPQHINTPGSTGNTIPTASTSNVRQILYYGSDFTTAPASGTINTIYLQASAVVSFNYTNFVVKMGNTSLTALATGPWITGLTTVFSSATFTGTTGTGNWVAIPLQTPFSFSSSQNFIVEISQGGYSPGFTTLYSAVNDRSIYGTSTATSGTIQARLANFGFDMPVTCSGTPSVATAAGPTSAVCTGASFNLTASGQSVSPNIIYRWQSRVGTTGAFTYIPGATTIPYAASATANSQYRLVTTCPTSSLSDTSNIVTVNITPRPHVDSISETHNAVGVYNFLSHGATNVTSYSWNFGDATPLGTGAAPIHTYVSSGTYTVRLITTNSCGTDTVTKTINVVVPPQCITSPNPLNLTSPTNTVCANTSLIITANNASTGPASWHVWQSSPAGLGNWTTLAVNKDTTFTTFITATTDFRMRDSCAIPPGAVSSNVLQIALPAAPQITAIARSNTGLTYNFSATGVANVTSYVWNFGDNTPTSTLPSPTHTYAVNGDYMVTVTVSNGCTSEIRIIKFSTINVGVNTLNIDDAFRVYPNPANQYVDISANDKMQITDLSLINSMGMEVKAFNNIRAKDFRLETKDLPAGNYFLRINTPSCIISKSFQIIR